MCVCVCVCLCVCVHILKGIGTQMNLNMILLFHIIMLHTGFRLRVPFQETKNV